MWIFPSGNHVIDCTVMVIAVRRARIGNSIRVFSGIGFCRGPAITFIRIIIIIIYIFLEGIAVRDLRRAFLYHELRSSQNLTHFHGIVYRYSGNCAVHGSTEAGSHFLL